MRLICAMKKFCSAIMSHYNPEKARGFISAFFNHPIILSLIAAIIFWMLFSFIPEKQRYNKLRPKIELEMVSVYSNLFSYFDRIMQYNRYSPSNYQYEIRSGTLSDDLIEIGLLDKCLNDSYLFDPVINSYLMVVGEDLKSIALKIDDKIEKMFNFSNYISANEILLFEKIREKLLTYDYTNKAVTKVGKKTLRPLNPSILYMKKNISELYQLFLELQNNVFNNTFSNRELTLYKSLHFLYSGQYKQCREVIHKSLKLYENDKYFFNYCLLLCDYKSGERQKAYNLLEKVLKEKKSLVSYRDFLKEIFNDEMVLGLLNRYYTPEEIKKLRTTIKQEHLNNIAIKDRAVWLKCYYMVDIKDRDEWLKRNPKGVTKERLYKAFDSLKSMSNSMTKWRRLYEEKSEP